MGNSINNPAITEIDNSNLSNAAYRLLEEKIVTLELAPGSVLSEIALSKMLGIGRTPVREALQRLAREGLINILPRRGILVSEVNIKSQIRMLEVRREIERLMARSAAERATGAERNRFQEIAAEMVQAAAEGDDKQFLQLDLEFNQLVSSAAHNEFASKAIALMSGLSRRFWFMHHQYVDDLSLTAEYHAAVARSIAAGEGAEAAAASDRLMDYIEKITREMLDS